MKRYSGAAFLPLFSSVTANPHKQRAFHPQYANLSLVAPFWHIAQKHAMQTILLIATGLVLFVLFFKFIQWFEKI